MPTKKKEEKKKEEPAVKKAVEKEVAPKEEKKNSYIYSLGRRKSASATVRLYKNGKGEVTVNGKPLNEYFPTIELRRIVLSPLVGVGQDDKLDVTAKVLGGGVKGQAEAIRHAISRTLEKLNPNFRKALKKHGYLTRDPRVKERKKPGLKRARRRPQWAKR